MQSLQWYYRRLRTMSPAEIAWRVRSLVRDCGDYARIRSGIMLPGSKLPDTRAHDFSAGFSVLPGDAHANDIAAALDDSSKDALLYRANAILDDRLSYFDLEEVHHGTPVDWLKDHSSGKKQALRPIQRIDYRDFDAVGDCKLVWEPNRHHQFVVLAQAFAVGGDVRYVDKLVQLFESWLQQNPFGYGMNWRSPLELGIRLINWVWALDMVRHSGRIDDGLWSAIRRAAYRMCWDIDRKYSQGSSSNNHLIGEAAGVFVAASYFSDFPDASGMVERARIILETEIIKQSSLDGSNREQALGYQFFVMQFFLVCALVAHRRNTGMSPAFNDRLMQQYRYIAVLSEGGHELPMFGDKDDGYVLDLGCPVTDVNFTVATGACLFESDHLGSRVQDWPSTLRWLFDADTIAARVTARNSRKEKALASHAFTDAGHYLLQSGRQDSPEAVSLLFDCAELGFGALAAHGHADALSFTLRAGGKAFFVDSGTFDYFSHPEARNYFRSTKAHNTVEIDGLSQSEIAGPFLWSSSATARCTGFQAGPDGASVSGCHDGYERLDDPVAVHRAVDMLHDGPSVRICDRFDAHGEHIARCYFHVHPDAAIEDAGDNAYVLRRGDTELRLTVDPGAECRLHRADDQSLLAWISDSYHHKKPSACVVVEKTFTGNTELTHEILVVRRKNAKQ